MEWGEREGELGVVGSGRWGVSRPLGVACARKGTITVHDFNLS